MGWWLTEIMKVVDFKCAGVFSLFRKGWLCFSCVVIGKTGERLVKMRGWLVKKEKS